MTDDDRSPSTGRSLIELAGVVLLLAIWAGALYRFAGAPDPARLPARPGWEELVTLARSRAVPLDGVLQVTILVQWVICGGLAAWLLLSVTLELLLGVAELGPAKGASWLRGAQALVRHASFPFVHQLVATIFALQLVVRPPSMAFAQALGPTTEQIVPASPGSATDGQLATTDGQLARLGDAAVLWHTVQRGETLWGIAERYYGAGAEFERLIDANVGRPMPGNRTFTPAGMIYPGAVLEVPLPSSAIVERNGQRFYVVEPGDTLRGIAARLLGDPDRYEDLFALNVGVAQVGDQGPVLADPDLIWPGLRLQLASGDANRPEPSTVQPDEGASASAIPPPPPALLVASEQQERTAVGEPADVEHKVADVEPDVTSAPAPTTLAAPTPVAEPAEAFRTERHPLSPEQAAVAAAGAAAVALAAGTLVVRRRRPAPIPSGPESDIQIEDGFAQVDPVEDLARRLARTSDPAAAIASLLGQAYVAVFDEQLRIEERREATDGVSIAAARHGRTSTTLAVAAPVPARPHLVHCMRAAAERAFGEQVDVDGLVDQNGDVLVRLTWDPRRPVAGHLLELVNASPRASAWPAPCLVPTVVLRDRQRVAVNWHDIGNVLVAAPAGQGAETLVTALVVALASVRTPEDLGLVLLARPHTLPDEVGVFPHGLLDPVDSGDPAAVQRALESVRDEIDRRAAAGSTADADLVVVVREMGDLEPGALSAMSGIAALGPHHGVRLLVASEQPVAEMLRICPFMDQLGTRLVLQTASEEDSVALLGMPGAEDLGAGGHVLLRLEGRVPIQGLARRVPGDYLARLVHLMGTRPAFVPAPADGPLAGPVEQAPHPQTGDESTGCEVDTAGNPPAVQLVRSKPTALWPGSPLLRQLREAPIRVRCFGARQVWCGDRLLQIGDPELLLLLAVHPVTGIQTEALVDMLWDDVPADPAAALRKERYVLRNELRDLIPEKADPVPGNQSHGEKVVSLDTAIVSSDVHEFSELLNWAGTLDTAAAVEVYEAALALYRGDLLDSADMPSYRWMYDEDPQVALTLRSDYRRRQKEARLRLADLLGGGAVAGLGRAQELYEGLCAEDPEDERLWTALFKVHERTGSSLGLESAVRRLRASLVELGADAVDVESVPLPSNLDRLVQQIRQRIDGTVVEQVASA